MNTKCIRECDQCRDFRPVLRAQRIAGRNILQRSMFGTRSDEGLTFDREQGTTQ